jgi:hypothetical protein
MHGLDWMIGKSFLNCSCLIQVEIQYADITRAFGSSSGALVVRLYLRQEDNRARILCKWLGRTGGIRYSCLPLNVLDIHRSGPSLLLRRRTVATDKVEIWARLKFSTMESKQTLQTVSILV